MAKDVLIDEHVSTKQCEKAIAALLDHALKRQEKQEQTQLLGAREQHVWLNITVKHMNPEKKLKPFKIPLVHPLVDPRTSSVCLITKDPQREYKDLLETHNVKFVSAVVGVEKLRGKHKPFDRRRLLLKSHGLFLADERVIPLLPSLLGKIFFKAKKQPIPVNLTRKNLKGELEAAISSTYFHQNNGTNSSIKISTLTHTPAQILANLQKALPAVIKHIKGAWDNIQSLHIKTSFSTALPIWSCELGSDAGARWDGLVADAEMSDAGSVREEEAGESDEEMEVEAEKPKAKGKKVAEKDVKGKKRAVEDEDEVEKPKKKVKGTAAEPKTTTESSKPVAKKVKASSESKLTLSEPSPSSPPAPKSSKKRKAAKESEETAAPAQTAPEIAPVPAEIPPTVVPTSSDIAAVVSPKKRKPRHSKKAQPEPPATESANPPPTVPEPAPVPTDSAPEEPPAKKKRRKAKQGAIDTAAPSGPIPPSEPATTLAVALSTDISQPAQPTPEAPKPKKRKKAKADAAAGALATETGSTQPPTVAPTPATSSSPAPKLSSKLQSAPAEPQTPVSALSKKKTKDRATAADFFESGDGKVGQPSTPAATPTVKVPPNTPADGLVVPIEPLTPLTPGATKGKKKPRHRAKGSIDVSVSIDIGATPISGTIGKLTVSAGDIAGKPDDDASGPVTDRKSGDGVNGGGDGNDRALDTSVVAAKTSKAKGKKEKKKSGSGVPEASVEGFSAKKVTSGGTSEKEAENKVGYVVGVGEEKRKRKRSKKGVPGESDGPDATPVVVITDPSAADQSTDSVKTTTGPAPEEVKKKRSSSGVEKKKAKILKGKGKTGESAKEALVGKKGL